MTDLSPEEFNVSHDAHAAKMENELLRLENQYLKAKLGDEVGERGARMQGDPASGGEGRVVIDRSEYESLCRAFYDLRWLLNRLEDTPFRIILRRFEGWRTLVSKHSR